MVKIANPLQFTPVIPYLDLSMTNRYSHLTFGHKSLLQDRLAEYYSNNGKLSGVHIGYIGAEDKKEAD